MTSALRREGELPKKAVDNTGRIYEFCGRHLWRVPYAVQCYLPPAALVPVALLLVAGVVPALLPPHHLPGARPPALARPHQHVAIALFELQMCTITMAKCQEESLTVIHPLPHVVVQSLHSDHDETWQSISATCSCILEL